MLRPYKASGYETPHTVRFGTHCSHIEAVDLRGEPLETPAIQTRGGGTEVELSMPRFGLKTLRLTK